MENPKGNRGFTLVEILTAVAVLALIGLLIAQLIGATTRATRLSNRSIDAAGQARLALDRIGADLAAIVSRPDVDFVARNPSVMESNAESRNALFFLSSVISASPGTPFVGGRGDSLVAYQVGPHADNGERLCLLRAGMALPWNRPVSWGSGHFIGLKSNGLPIMLGSRDASFPAALIPGTDDFDVLAPGVIRMVVGFQLNPDNRAVDLLDGTHLAHALGQVVYSPPLRGDTGTEKYIDLTRVASLVVGVVALDLESLRLLSADDVSVLTRHFDPLSFNASTPNVPVLPVAAWKEAADTAISTGIPLPAAQSVRVFQRFYPINPFGSRAP